MLLYEEIHCKWEGYTIIYLLFHKLQFFYHILQPQLKSPNIEHMEDMDVYTTVPEIIKQVNEENLHRSVTT